MHDNWQLHFFRAIRVIRGFIDLSFGSYKMELNRNLCAFSAGSKALRAGRYNGDAKAIVLCVAHNFHERQRVYFHFYFLFYFRKFYQVI